MYAIVLKYQMGSNASRTRTLSDTLMWFFWVNGRLRIRHSIFGLDHGVGHFRPLSITRQRHLLAYHGTAMSHEGLCQVF